MCSWYGGSRLLDDAVVGAVEASDVKDEARPRRVGRGVEAVIFSHCCDNCKNT